MKLSHTCMERSEKYEYDEYEKKTLKNWQVP
jgi:hypothetical protein